MRLRAITFAAALLASTTAQAWDLISRDWSCQVMGLSFGLREHSTFDTPAGDLDYLEVLVGTWRGTVPRMSASTFCLILVAALGAGLWLIGALLRQRKSAR